MCLSLFRLLVRDRVSSVAALVLALMIIGAIGGECLSPYAALDQDLRARNQPPTFVSTKTGQPPHLLGTDHLGRDMLARLLAGARVSMTVGLLSVLLSGSAGILLGLVAGYYRGWVDDIVMRVVDIQMGFPSLLLALTILYVAGSNFVNLVIVLSLSGWMWYARMTRGMLLSLREAAFVESARAIGCRDRRIMFLHLLPNLASPLLIGATLHVAGVILAEAGLSFLGLGIQLPQSSWGLMLSQGKQYIDSAWWQTVFPGLAIFLTTLSLNLIVTWLRAVSDPAQRARLQAKCE